MKKFIKALDFSLPMLISCIAFGLILFSCDSKAVSVRTDITDILTDDKLSTRDCLVTALYFESRSESDMANIMVLNSIYNRVKSKHFPNTPCKVVKQPKQYSFTHDGISDKMINLVQVKRLESIVDQYLLNKGLFLSLSEGVNHYHRVDISPKWSKSERMVYIGTLDQHKFYRRK